jgi:hypothetical protein
MSRKELIDALHTFKVSFREYTKSFGEIGGNKSPENEDELVESYKPWDTMMVAMNKNLKDGMALDKAIGEYCLKFPESSNTVKKRMAKVSEFYKNSIKSASVRLKEGRHVR